MGGQNGTSYHGNFCDGVPYFPGVPPPAAAAEPAAKASNDVAAEIKAARGERIKVLADIVEIVTSQYKAATADFAQVFSAENDLYNARLDATDDPEKRIALLTKHLAKAGELVEYRQQQVRSGTVGETEVLRAKSLCLEIKIRLLRERPEEIVDACRGKAVVRLQPDADSYGAVPCIPAQQSLR